MAEVWGNMGHSPRLMFSCAVLIMQFWINLLWAIPMVATYLSICFFLHCFCYKMM